MLDFKKITKDDFEIIDSFFERELEQENRCLCCDYAPGTVKMWHNAYSMEYALCEDMLFLSCEYEEERGRSYLMPLGANRERGLSILYEYLKDKENVTLSVIDEGLIEKVSEIFKVDAERIFADRDWADYLYRREDFINPSGKKHHNYKYNLNKFSKDHPNGKVIPICEENAEAATEFFKAYCIENPESSSVDDDEYDVTLKVLSNLADYSMSGALLADKDEIIGLTLGEVYGDTVIVHTEKARKDIQGAYQTLAFGYQKMMPDHVLYINREEDMGLEGLRRSKLSYAPEKLLMKYTLYYK